ncbi:class I SAM-dependent methyltransferase [Pseudomonas aeruginosa]|nr:class I SAM-dependent methyltransferase [Pseudomonas aeruginosa]
MSDHDDVVQRQFGAQAAAYLSSAVHAQGEEFALLRDALAGRPEARVLDLGCGAGHVSFRSPPWQGRWWPTIFPPRCSPWWRRAPRNGAWRTSAPSRARRRACPSPTARFDFVFSRYSTHHWRDVGLALREVRRLLKPGGVAIFVDVAAPGQALPDTFLQTVELLRDTSHVRNYSPAEWARLSGEAGLLVTGSRRQRLRLEFQSWVERMRTPEVFRQAIRSLQLAVGEEVREYFEIADDGSFSTDVLVLWLRRE